MDLFSSYFYLNANQRELKKTSKSGTLLSIIIISLSIAYFLYLLIFYATGGFQPRVTISTEQVPVIEHKFSSSPFQFGIFPGTDPVLSKLDIGKIFYLGVYVCDGIIGCENEIIPVFSDPCEEIEPGFKGQEYMTFQCIDTKKSDVLSKAFEDGTTRRFEVILMECDTTIMDSCYDQSIIHAFLSQRDFYLQMNVVTQQYDVTEKKYRNVIKQKRMFGDFNTAQFLTFYLQKGVLEIDDSFLISSYSSENYIKDYQLEQSSFSQDFARQKFQIIGGLIFYMQVKLDTVQTITKVEYIKFSEILAMFLAIFNSLMGIGALAKMATDSSMREELMDVILRSKYRQTYYDLAMVQLQDEQKQIKDESKRKEITKKDVDEKIDVLICQNGFESLARQKFLFRNNKMDKDGNEMNFENTYVSMYKRFNSEFNIKHLYYQIQELKFTQQMLLDKYQYCAIKQAGKRSPLFVSQDQEKNHAEMLEDLDQDKDEQQKLLEEFVSKVKDNKEQLSQIDKNIYNCLIDKEIKMIDEIEEDKKSIKKQDDDDDNNKQQGNSKNSSSPKINQVAIEVEENDGNRDNLN